MAVTRKDLWTTVKGLLLEQYRNDLREEIEAGTYVDGGVERHYELPEGANNRLQGMLKAVVDELLQPVDDAALDIGRLADVSRAEGEWLDVLGKLAGRKRNYQESDNAFRLRVEAALYSDNAGAPDNVIYNSAILSGDPRPQYFDEATATFFVYTGARPDGSGGWDEGGLQLSRAQVRKMAPAGVLGLPGAAITDADGGYLADASGRLIVAVANDSTIEREVLLADNLGNLVVTPQSVPVRVVLRGATASSIPTVTVDWNGVPVDAVRIMDLPAAGDTNGYFVRDSDTEGTTSARAMDEQALDELWNSTPPEGD